MNDEVKKAVELWQRAPLHVRTLAGSYVEAMLDALVSLSERVERLEAVQ